MDAYKRLLYETNLYDKDVIEKIAASQPEWGFLTNSQKENLCCHITSCMLLCNKEPMIKKRKIQFSTESDLPPSTKRRMLLDAPSTSSDPPQYVTPAPPQTSEASGTSGSSADSSEDYYFRESLQDPDTGEDYRFELIRYSYFPHKTLNEACKKHGIPVPSAMWDIVDNLSGTLVNLYIHKDEERTKVIMANKLLEIGNRGNAYIVPHGRIKGDWMKTTRPAVGESKLTAFLASRSQFFEENNLLTSAPEREKGLEEMFNASLHKQMCIRMES